MTCMSKNARRRELRRLRAAERRLMRENRVLTASLQYAEARVTAELKRAAEVYDWYRQQLADLRERLSVRTVGIIPVAAWPPSVSP